MKLFSGLRSAPTFKSGKSGQELVAKITIQMLLFGAVVAVSITCYSRRSTRAVMPSTDFGSSSTEMAGASGLEGQAIEMNRGRYKINADAFNYERKKKISLESAELLSLANALRLEVARHPGASLSGDAVRKLSQIEKLAHSVKNQMQINPVLGPI